MIYLVFYFIILSFALCKNYPWAKGLEKCLVSVIGLFLCMGYMTGSDWRQYEPLYETTKWINCLEPQDGSSVGYNFYSMCFKQLGFGFWTFFITTKIGCYGYLVSQLKRYLGKDFYFGFLFFYGVFALPAFIDDPMRNLMAAVIFTFALKFLFEKRVFYYFLLVCVAATFHLSAIFAFPFYFFSRLRFNAAVLMLTTGLLTTFIFFKELAARELLADILRYTSLPLLQKFNWVYFHEELNSSEGSALTIGFMINLFLFGLIYLKQKEFEKIKSGRMIFNCFLAYCVFYLLGFIAWILFRFRFFTMVPFCICVGLLPSFFIQIRYKIIIRVLLIVISLATMRSTVTGSYKYVPYSNIIFEKEKSFYSRSIHNPKNSPYAK